jgi:hypothetical protein
MSFRLTSEPAPRFTEAEVIDRCKILLARRGYYLHRNPVGKYRHASSGNFAEFGPAGIPDYLAIHRMYPAFFLEFKRPGAKLREVQRTKFGEIQIGYRLAAVMVDSVEELQLFMDGHEARARAP